MKKLFLFFFLLLLACGGALIYFGYSAVEEQPLVTSTAAANSDNAQKIKDLVQRYQDGAARGNATEKLSVTEEDLESLLAFATRGLPRSRADANIDAKGMRARMTLELPENPLGRFLNISFGLLPSQQGLVLSHVSIGKINLPPNLLLPIIRRGLDATLGEGSGDTILNTVSSVEFSGRVMALTYSPDTSRSEELIKKIAESEQLRLDDPERVQIYYTRLQEIAKQREGGYLPFTQYLSPVFQLAADRSRQPDGDAVSENKSAILALALYFGDPRMRGLFGRSTKKYFSGSRLGAHNVSIKKRHDLVQHYLTSAGLQIAAGVNVANAIGEYKEIADTLRGGSGFSFSDIAADRAGVVLAEIASDESSAQRLQNVLAGAVSEDAYFPDISGLPDNMTQSEFEARFVDVENEKYLAVMADIERRIAQLPAYRKQ